MDRVSQRSLDQVRPALVQALHWAQQGTEEALLDVLLDVLEAQGPDGLFLLCVAATVDYGDRLKPQAPTLPEDWPPVLREAAYFIEALLRNGELAVRHFDRYTTDCGHVTAEGMLVVGFVMKFYARQRARWESN